MNLLDQKSGIPLSCRAVWASRLTGEESAPEKRIIHSRCVQLNVPARLERIGIRMGEGYLKCGGNSERDWITAFRVLVPGEEGQWKELLHIHATLLTDNEPVQYFALGNAVHREIIIEVRRSGVDNWWPSWNIAMDGLILEADIVETNGLSPILENTLLTAECDLSVLPEGVEAVVSKSDVHYRTKYFEIGFNLRRTGFTHFALDEGGEGNTDENLLQFPTVDKWKSLHQANLTQGVHLHPLGNRELVGYQGNEAVGSVSIKGNKVIYEIKVPSLEQTYRLCWTVEEDRFEFEAERESRLAVRAWKSSVWSMALDSQVMPTTVLGSIIRSGEAGTVDFPLFFHAPKFGTFQVNELEGDGMWRFDSVRPIHTNVHEIKLGEVPQPEGDYLLLPGKHCLKLEFKLYRADLVPTDDNAPAIVAQAVNTRLITGLTYRADTDTFSNNGNSIHSVLCLDYWSSLTVAVHRLKPEWNVCEMLRNTLERWLEDAPGYGSGRTYYHDLWLEDEYLMGGTSALFGLAEYINFFGDAAWVAKYSNQIQAKLEQMKKRDLDGDGLIESDKRLGISGQYQWSTNWYDAISFGWKDAFVNAQLYSALRLLVEGLSRLKMPGLADGLMVWADRLKQSYFLNFYNKDTEWFAGWRCKENKLHDYAFLYVNGIAVTSGLLDDLPQLSRSVIEKLWREMQKTGFMEYRFGLPGNLWNIPDADMAKEMHNLPFGTYENGGATLSQARHFLGAMYKVGLHLEADEMLAEFCYGLASGTAFGGCDSGVDWRMWDGSPCGYEGLLCDQFGVLIPCVERYFM